MANCILCGQKVGLLDRKNYMFHGVAQTLCIGCTARLDNALPQEREELLKKVTAGIANVEVYSFSGLLVDFMKRFDSAVIIKGLRTISDFEYEFQMALLNKSLNPDVETFFMMTDSKYSYISSSMVKEVARWGGSIDEFVPCDIIEVINKKFEEKSRK